MSVEQEAMSLHLLQGKYPLLARGLLSSLLETQEQKDVQIMYFVFLKQKFLLCFYLLCLCMCGRGVCLPQYEHACVCVSVRVCVCMCVRVCRSEDNFQGVSSL